MGERSSTPTWLSSDPPSVPSSSPPGRTCKNQREGDSKVGEKVSIHDAGLKENLLKLLSQYSCGESLTRCVVVLSVLLVW